MLRASLCSLGYKCVFLVSEGPLKGFSEGWGTNGRLERRSQLDVVMCVPASALPPGHLLSLLRASGTAFMAELLVHLCPRTKLLCVFASFSIQFQLAP